MSASQSPVRLGVKIPENAVLLVRHGALQTQDDQRRYIGQTDLPLNETGLLQARWWARALESIALDAVYCSDLARSRRTAEIIAEGREAPLTALPDLREINLGHWEGEAFETIRANFPAEYSERGRNLADFRPPGGESFGDLQNRAVPAFETIAARHPGQGARRRHAGVNRVLLCHILGMDLSNLFRLGQDYAALNLIARSGGGFRAMAVNLPPGELDAFRSAP